MKRFAVCVLLVAASGSLTGCRWLAGVTGEDIELSVENEYWLGRSVAAQIITDKNSAALPDQQVSQYLNELANYLFLRAGGEGAIYRPDGKSKNLVVYLVKGNEIGAWALPGGFVLLTEGMVRRCQDEDELAGVIGHEIYHVINKDSKASIESAREKAFAGKMVAGAASLLATAHNVSSGGEGTQIDPELAGKMGQWLGESITGLVDLIGGGWPKKVEQRCDRESAELVHKSGYHAPALGELLKRLAPELQAAQGMFPGLGSHGDITERVNLYQQKMAELGSPKPSSPLSAGRFQAMRQRLG